jgi:hypothetical protein
MRQLGADACLTILRRAEMGLAPGSRAAGDEDPPAHGVDRVTALARTVDAATLAEVGRGSSSPRMWGFWSQYGGPSQTLGTVAVDTSALRPGRHECPASIRAMFEPLLTRVAQRPVVVGGEDFTNLAMEVTETSDVGPLR